MLNAVGHPLGQSRFLPGKHKLIKFCVIIFFIILSVLTVNTLITAHEGHDDAPPSNNGAPLGDPFFVSKETQFILGIKTDVAIKRYLNFTINSTGKIVPTTGGEADVFSPFAGFIVGTKIPIVGTYVRKGTVLATIQQTLALPEQLNVANEKFKAEAEYEQAVKDYNRLSDLQGVVAEKEFIAAEIRLNAAKKTVNYYSSLLKGSTNTTNYFTLTSPISGTIVETNLTTGEKIDPSKKLFSIVDLSTLWIQAEIYETDIAKLQDINYATASAQTYPDKYFDANLINIGSVVDEVTRTVKVLFVVNNADRLLKVGMFASLNIFTKNEVEALTVPKESVVDIGGKNVVFIHTKAQTFKGVEVLIGRTDGQYVEILSGLKAGARVVTTGNYQLRASVK